MIASAPDLAAVDLATLARAVAAAIDRAREDVARGRLTRQQLDAERRLIAELDLPAGESLFGTPGEQLADVINDAQRVSGDILAFLAELRADEPDFEDDEEIAELRGAHDRLLAAVEGEAVDEGESRVHDTDLGNARRLVRAHGADLRYVAGLGWHAWTGARWRPDDDGEAQRRAKTIPQLLRDEAVRHPSRERAEQLWRHALRTEGAARIEAMLQLARTETAIVAHAEELDADPHLLNTPAGTVDLRTGRLQPHNREDLITKITGAGYDSEARAPRFEAFLQEITDGDSDLIAYLQRAAGYSVTGRTDDQVFFLIHGDGANGKSTLINALRDAAGHYACAVDPVTFTTTASTRAARSDIARLRGARLVTGMELEHDATLAEVLIKAITGGDAIVARSLYRDEIQFEPSCKLWLTGNHLPDVQQGGAALWRRVRVLPLTAHIVQRDPKLRDKLRAEAPGILAWTIRGAVDWHQHGLGTCGAVDAASDRYQRAQDRVQQFLDECCEIDETARTPVALMNQTYLDWERANGRDPLPIKTLGTRLTQRGHKSETVRGIGRARFGLRLAEDAP